MGNERFVIDMRYGAPVTVPFENEFHAPNGCAITNIDKDNKLVTYVPIQVKYSDSDTWFTIQSV